MAEPPYTLNDLKALQQWDTPMNIYARPANIFVAGFIGTPSMNLLSASVESAGGGQATEFGVDQGQELPGGLGIAPLDRREDVGDLVHGVEYRGLPLDIVCPRPIASRGAGDGT